MKQKGYTLLELLLVTSITGFIVLVVGASIVQIMGGRVDIVQRSIALADIDNAVHWLTRDLVLAQTTSLVEEAPPTSSMDMSWSDLTGWAQDEGSVEHSARYTLSGTQLLRYYDGEMNIAGRHITNVGFSIEGKVFTVTLTSQPGLPRSTVTRSFSIQIRSDLGP